MSHLVSAKAVFFLVAVLNPVEQFYKMGALQNPCKDVAICLQLEVDDCVG